MLGMIDLMSRLFENVAQQRNDLRLIVDDEDALAAAAAPAFARSGREPAASPLRRSAAKCGNGRRPFVLRQQFKSPPCALIDAEADRKAHAGARPTDFVVKKGSKMRDRKSGSTPGPVSAHIGDDRAPPSPPCR